MEESYVATGDPKLAVQVESEQLNRGGFSFRALPVFNTYSRKSHWIDVYNQGGGMLDWKSELSDEWIVLSRQSGSTRTEDRIQVSIDWNKVPSGEKVTGFIEFSSGMQKERVLVSVFNPKTPVRDELQGLFIEENGYVSLPATAFHRKFESEDVKMSVLPGLGFEGAALQIGSPIAPLQMYRSSEVPRVEYDFILSMLEWLMCIPTYCPLSLCMLIGIINYRSIPIRIPNIVSVSMTDLFLLHPLQP